MITPEFLSYELDILKVHNEFEESVLRDIVRRIKKAGYVTDTAAYQTEVLQEAGFVYNDIIKEVAKQTKASEDEIKKIFLDAETEVFNYSEELILSAGYDVKAFKSISPEMRSIINAALKKTSTEAVNLTKTCALTGQNLYISSCDLAHMQVISGAFDKDTAIKNAIRNAAVQGLSVIYPSGKKASLDAAVRRSVLTGVNQTYGQIQYMRSEEFGCDLMIISAHYGARPEHAAWQGQLVSKSGRKEYLSLDDIGYGEVTGFQGANCRHSWNIFFEGLSNMPYSKEQLERYKNATVTYNDKEYKAYDAIKKQRSMERGIRATRRELVAFDECVKTSKTDEEKNGYLTEFNNSSVKLKGQEAKLRDFLKQTGLTEDKARVQIYMTKSGRGFNKSVSGKATAAYKDFVDNGKRNAIIKEYLKNNKIKLEVNDEKQNHHFKDSKDYVPGKSYLTITREEIQKIVNEKCGTGKVYFTKQGEWNKKEKIDCGFVIGVDIDEFTGKETPVTKATIHYSKTGTHLVPRKES